MNLKKHQKSKFLNFVLKILILILKILIVVFDWALTLDPFGGKVQNFH
jgi:hypothetical protein